MYQLVPGSRAGRGLFTEHFQLQGMESSRKEKQTPSESC